VLPTLALRFGNFNRVADDKQWIRLNPAAVFG
jgi:hypothetical protein